MALRLRKSAKQRSDFGRIEKLVIENFKSYAGRQEIGPFDKFTCVIGPNGSGKSNVMDAISFCLGIKTKHLRGERLKDLVYKREEETVDANTRSAQVVIHFRTASGDELQFGRTITSRGDAFYRFGSEGQLKTLSYDEYVNELAKENIFVRARSFLVFQGDVMELARRQGAILSSMLETISGSELLKDRYQQLSKELELQQEKARMHFQHRREAENAVALLEQQRAEVERYHDLRAQREALQVETALFKLYCAEQEAELHLQAMSSLKEEAARGDGQLKSRRKEIEDADARRKKLDAELKEAQSQHFLLSSNVEQCKPEIANCRKQAAHWTMKLREKEAQVQQEELRIQSFEGALKKASADRANAESQLQKLQQRSVSSALKMSPQQRKEFEQAVLQTQQLNTKARDKLQEADEKIRQVEREMKDSKEDLRSREEKKRRFAGKLEELNREKMDLEIKLDTENIEVQASKRQMEKIEEEIKTFVNFRDTLTEELQTLRNEVDAVKARRDRLEQVEVRQRVADELRARFPDAVLGRISELVLPTQKRFDFALQMSLGAMTEAFVVRDARSARDCVQFLKERQMSSETFLPLDRMEEPQVGALHKLTQGSQARRLATMCVKHNEKFMERHDRWREQGPSAIDRTVTFLLKGVVVVDDLEEAKATAFRDAKKHKLMPRVVTLEGEVVAPNGNMSVKSRGAAGLVEFGGAEKLQAIRDKEKKLLQVEKDLETLDGETIHKKQQEAELKSEVAGIEAEHKLLGHRMSILESSAAAEQKALDKLSKEVEALGSRIDKGGAALAKLQKEKESMEAEMLKVGRSHFQKLNSELGVDDVREVVLREQREKQKLQAEVEQFEDFVRQLQAEEQRAEQRVKSTSRLEAFLRDQEGYQRDIQTAEKRLGDLERKQQATSERCEAARLRLKEATVAQEQFQEETKSAAAEIHKLKAELDEAKKKLKKAHEKARLVLSYKFTVFRECSEKQIEVPLLKESEATMEKVLSRRQDVDDMSFKDLEAACRDIKVTYTKLPQDKKELAAALRIVDTKAVEAEYAEQIADIAKELEGLSPNMRASEEADAEGEKLKEIQSKASEASMESQRLMREFEAVKGERVAKFMTCFKHVESHLQPYYKDLTSYDGFEGGAAYLDLDDAEEPYNGGITFTACPPGKRFFPMELLSGGERSMAAMALLFAMHSYRPPPFMILDEVDAPFDKKNTASLVNYLRKLNFQVIVISLKDTLFSHSDSIIGVFKDKEEQTSGTVRLALSKLGQASETPETEVPLAEAINDG